MYSLVFAFVLSSSVSEEGRQPMTMLLPTEHIPITVLVLMTTSSTTIPTHCSLPQRQPALQPPPWAGDGRRMSHRLPPQPLGRSRNLLRRTYWQLSNWDCAASSCLCASLAPGSPRYVTKTIWEWIWFSLPEMKKYHHLFKLIFFSYNEKRKISFNKSTTNVQ